MEEQEDFPSENVGEVYSKKSDRSTVQVPTESAKFPPFFIKKIPPNEKEEEKKVIRRFRNVSHRQHRDSCVSRLNTSSNGIVLKIEFHLKMWKAVV